MSASPQSVMVNSQLPASGGMSVVADADVDDGVPSFPPYPPYATEPVPPSVAETITAGHGLRLKHKSKQRKSLRPLPKPAKPKTPKATDVKMSQHTMRAHARCLRKHNAILTDRLEYISRPRRRNVICFWRENAGTLSPDTIARFRSMLDADETFKPDQAYEYFVNLKRTKKKATTTGAGVQKIKKDMLAMCGNKKFVWARNATVAFARGIQQRLSRPGRYALADGMLRLSDIILHEMCGYMNMKTPSRRCTNSKAKFMMEMSDKIAVWIDEILYESDDRMLMMDFDEDDDVYLAAKGGGLYGDDDAGDGYAGDDGDMLGGSSAGQRAKREKHPAYLKFEGNMRIAFDILTDSMEAKGNEKLLTVGKFDQTYNDAAHELKQATDLKATEFSAKEAEKIKNKLKDLTESKTPPEIADAMTDMHEICSEYLAQNAEYNKEKGPAFKLLLKEMNKTPNAKMYELGKIKKTNAQAAQELYKAKGMEVDHDEPNLSQSIYSTMTRLVSKTPPEMKKDMDETVDVCSKYLSQKAVDDNERGPAFDLLIKELENQGNKPFCDYPALSTRNTAAYVLKSAPGLGSVTPDPKTVNEFKAALHKAVDPATPKEMEADMNNVIDLCSNYLSAFIRDRGEAIQALLKMMKSKPKTKYITRDKYTMDYGTAANEIENAPAIVPYLPVKDIADEGKAKLTIDMKDVRRELKIPVQALIKDVSKHLSQLVAIRSGVGGERYKMNFLAAVMKSFGSRPLYKYKSYHKTYADAADELYAADSKSLENLPPPVVNLGHQINSEMKRGIPTKLAPMVTEEMQPTMDIAAMHLAKTGVEKGDALDYVVNLMKDKGDDKLGKLQGYDQTYADGARRLEHTLTLSSENVDKAAYSSVKEKLTNMTQEKPDEKFKEVLPGLIDDSANFLAAPTPQTKAEQRQVLADLIGREGDKILGENEVYKMTYEKGGEDIMNAPVGVTKSSNETKNKEIVQHLHEVIPDKKLETILEETTKEGAAYLTDTIEGRGQALGVIEESLKKENQKIFIDVGAFKKNHKQTAEMVAGTPSLKSDNPSPVIMENVEHTLQVLPKDTDKPMAKLHMKSTTDLTAKYISSEATKDCGLNAKQLAALDAEGFNAKAKVADESHRQAAHGVVAGETQEQRPWRLMEAEKERSRQLAEAERIRRETGKYRGGAIGAGGLNAKQLAALDAEGFNAKAKVADESHRQAAHGVVAGETQEQRPRRLMEAEKERSRQLAEAERIRRETGKYRGGALGADPEHLAALDILHRELKVHGTEVFYQQPKTTVTHVKVSEWLADPDPMKVDKSVKDSSDTARLHQKFERKLNGVVKDKTPPDLHDIMQDVVIEAARKTAEFFVTKNYNAHIKDGIVSEMQNRGNEILIEADGAAETYFFASQRLKRKDPHTVKEPCYQVSADLGKKLDDMMRTRPMPRKLNGIVKEHVKESAQFLSSEVTKPDDYIEAYVALLAEMEAAGDAVLIDGEVPKTYKEAANYLRRLTSFEDEIGRPNKSMQDVIQSRLKMLMSQAPPTGRRSSGSVMNSVIADSARLLVSYVMLQALKAEALDILVKEMTIAEENALLRHGPIRKSFKEGADLLNGKTTDELHVTNADPVVARKIQIKLTNLMKNLTPPKYQDLMTEVIEDATMYLAVQLLEPRVIKVCKCYKNVFVQCELWCDDILRRVARPCCTCSRHISVQALQDLMPTDSLKVTPDQARVFAPGVEISFKTCPNQARTLKADTIPICPAHRSTTSYLLHTIACKTFGNSMESAPSTSGSETYSSEASTSLISPSLTTKQSTPIKSLLLDIHADNAQQIQRQQQLQSFETENQNRIFEETQPPTYSPAACSYNFQTSELQPKASHDWSRNISTPISETSTISQTKSGYTSRTPIISADHMVDWDATMVSLLWNMLAWRDWIQEIVDDSLAYQYIPSFARVPEETADSWVSFYRKVTTEALQWRQYCVFSRQLTTRLHLRYRQKEIVSPNSNVVKTKIYIECQEAMLGIIDMFNRWTQWLTLVVKETDSLQQNLGSEIPLYQMRWNHLKTKVEGYSQDWVNYNKFLKVSWEQKYSAVIADYLPSWKKPGPVWVASTCGAVPSGAVAAGIFESEVIWVAKTMHRCKVLPATLLPSKHCCLVYAEGEVHRYTKYEVMCNVEVHWVAWRGNSISKHAVSVAPGMYVGRVHYHGDHLLGAVHGPGYNCHVVIFGRPFAFKCYELLMLAGEHNQ